MASTKYFIFPLVLLALAINLTFSSAAEIEAADVAVPVIHIICANSEPISVNVADQAPVQLKPGQEHQVKVLDKKAFYDMTSYYLTSNFAAVDLYRPARDSGHAAVYWKADWWGYSISYDNVKYKRVVEWESE
ncbi:hypothetical protein CASFOL_009019 [Castilleja foliolosa]|uniref:Uncharacterized protein n=1 Tax=Castilleja foliolosa TaxID=1961234 RepID=A0ABD3E0P5_9LAMI